MEPELTETGDTGPDRLRQIKTPAAPELYGNAAGVQTISVLFRTVYWFWSLFLLLVRSASRHRQHQLSPAIQVHGLSGGGDGRAVAGARSGTGRLAQGDARQPENT